MVAALDESADEPAAAGAEPRTSRVNAIQDRTVSALLNGSLSGVDKEGELLQPPDKLSAPTSTISSFAVAVIRPTKGLEVQQAPASATSLVATVPRHAKSNVAERPALEKPQKLQAALPSSNDVPAMSPAPFTQPVQPDSTMANKPLSARNQADTSLPSPANIGAYPARTHQSSLPHDLNSSSAVLSSTVSMPGTEPIEHGIAAQPDEVPPTAADDQTPVPLHAIADHTPEKAGEPQLAPPADAVLIQPAAIPQGTSAVVPPRPFNSSTGSEGVESSAFPVTAVDAERPQIAVAHAAAGSRSVRANTGDNTQQHSAAIEGTHSQLNAAIVGAAAVRETASAMPSNTGQGPAFGTTSGAHTAETFMTLDGAGNSMQPTWFHAGARQAEAGFEDPALGWVSVRAGTNAGGISAVVLPGSADATQALGAHMAGLHDFLAEQHSPVESLTLAQNPGGDAGLSQNMQHQGQHQSPQDSSANAQATGSAPQIATVTKSEQATQLIGSVSQMSASGSGGVHISVMA